MTVRIGKFIFVLIGSLSLMLLFGAQYAQAQDDPQIGDILCTDGSFVKPSAWGSEAGKKPMGVVFLLRSGGGGLVVAVKDAKAAEVQWSTHDAQDVETLPNIPETEDALADFNGKAHTDALRKFSSREYPAAHAIRYVDYASA